MDNPSLLGQIILQEDRNLWDEHRHDALGEKKQREVQFRIRRRDGQIRWIEHACQRVTDNQGVFLGFRASNRDITRSKQAEEEARRHREELSHVSRVAMLGELTASLAHEVNQPLAAILSNAQAAQRFLTRDTPELDEVRNALADIVRDDQRAGGVIRRLHTLLRRGDIEQTPLDINEIIQEIVSLLHSEAVVKGISMKLHLAPDLPPAFGDRIQLQQVMLNLLLNGMEAMRDVEAGSRELLVRTSRGEPGTIDVAVQDSGNGLDEENMDHIFTPFFTTKTGGLGMGLSISRSIIQAHGGRLGARNNPDRGATFHFTLPASKGDSL